MGGSKHRLFPLGTLVSKWSSFLRVPNGMRSKGGCLGPYSFLIMPRAKSLTLLTIQQKAVGRSEGLFFYRSSNGQIAPTIGTYHI